MPRLEFAKHPADITFGDGLAMGFRLWTSTVIYWIAPAFAVGVVNGIVEATLGVRLADLNAGGIRAGVDPMPILREILPPFLLSMTVTSILAVIAKWVYLGIGVSALRDRPMTPGWVTARGLRVLGSELLTLVIAGLVLVVWALLAVVGDLMGIVTGGVLATGLGIYLTVRTIFWGVAIFDGAGVIDGLAYAWRLSRRDIGRLLGWGVGVTAVGFLPNLTINMTVGWMDESNPFRGAVQGTASQAFAAFAMCVLVVLYESERWRAGLTQAAAPGTPGGPGSPMPSPSPVPAPEPEPYDPNGPTPPPPPPSPFG